MNFISGNATLDNTWRRIKFQHITAVAGIALAVCSAVAVGGWQDGNEASLILSSKPMISNQAIRSPVETPQAAFYLVGSQAEADRAASLEAEAFFTRFASNVHEPARTIHILMAATEAQELAAQRAFGEATFDMEGVSLSFIDLRGR